MQWHYKLGRIYFQWLLQSERWNIIPELLFTIGVSELKCASCQFANIIIQYTDKYIETLYPQRKGLPTSLKCVHLNPWSKVTIYQFKIRVRGQIWSYFGNTFTYSIYLGRNIFYNEASSVIRVKPQVLLNGYETIRSVHSFNIGQRI